MRWWGKLLLPLHLMSMHAGSAFQGGHTNRGTPRIHAQLDERHQLPRRSEICTMLSIVAIDS
jgi:hypothetical protein